MNNVLRTKMKSVVLLVAVSTTWSVVAGLDFTVVNDGSTVATRGFVGCYYARNADPAYAGTYYLRNDTEAEDIDSPIKCLTHCSGQGYAYFGLICPTETEITCVCSNDLPDTELRAEECAGGTLTTATGCGSSQGVCTGVTASDLYAYEGYYVGGCEREAVFSTEQRAIATCTLTTPGVVDQVVVDSVDITSYMLGTETSYTISFDGSSHEIGLQMAGDDCSASGLSISCACSTCVTATCADCLWHGFELTNTSKFWKGWGTDTTLSGAWYLPSFDFSDWYYPSTALTGACFDNMPAPAYWYMVGGPEHYCEFEQCKVCKQEEISDPKNPRCIRSHPDDFIAKMDPYATSLLSLSTATATCAEGAGAGDIVCGDYVHGELAQETCTADPIADYNCDVEVCDVRDFAGNCYHYHNIPATFAVAESTCLLRGGHIAYTPDSRVAADLIGFLDGLQTPPGNTWLGIRSKSLCKFEPVDGSIEIGETRWETSNPDRCLASVSGGCGLDWKTTTDQDCCAQLTPSGTWESQPCAEERTFFCVTSTTSQYPDVSYVERFLTCDYDETTCPPDSYSANGRLLGTECRGSCDESCQVSGDCEYDTDCDSCDVCDVGGCDDPSCDADGCDGAGCDNTSCDEGSCDAAGCDEPSCDTKGCDQPSCDAASCDYASCDVQSCDSKGCDAAGCDVTSCDNPSCDSTSCDDGGCDANSCDDAACDEASCDLGGCDLGGCDDPSCDEPSCDRETCSVKSCDDNSCDAGGCDAPSCDENGCDLGGCDANGCDGDGCDGYGCDDPSCDRDCDTDCLADPGVCDSGEVCNTPDNSAAPEFWHGSCDYDAACDGSGAVFDSDCDFDSSCDKSACTNGVTCDGDEECDASVCQIDGTNCDTDEDCDADDGCDAADCSTYGGEACDNGLGDCTSQPSYCDGDEECDALLCEAGTCDGDESCDLDESCDDVNCARDFVALTGGVCDGDENCSPTEDCDAVACASDAENCDADEGCDANTCALDVTDPENCDADESCDATACSANEAVCDSDESCDGFVGICSAGGLSDPANCDGDESCDDDAGCDYDESCDKATCTFVQGDSPLTSAYNTTTCDQDESCDFDGGCDRATCNGETFCDGDEMCDRPTCEVGGYCDSNDEGCDLVACEADELDCDGDEECDGWVDGACEANIADCDLDEECDAGWVDSPCDQYPDPVCDGDESCDLAICEAEYDIDLGESANCDGDELCDLDDSCDISICEGGGACDGDEECDQVSCEGHGLSAKEYEVTYGNLDGFNSSYCDDAVNDELCDFDEDCDNAACDDSIDMTSCDLEACTYGNFCDDDEGCNFDGGCDNNGGCDFDEDCDFDESCDYDDSCDNDQSCDWDEGCDLDEDLLGSCDRSCDTATCDDTECDLCSGDCQICSDCLRCEENCPSGQYRQGCGATSQGACVACTNIAEKHFFNSHGRLRDQCKTVECTQNCPVGQYNDNCEFTTSDDENCVDCTRTPGYFFIDDGGTSDSCTARLCNLDCPRGQYLAGCEGTNAGACADCTEIPAGYFFKTNGRLLDNCEHEPCFTDCPFGEFNLGCEGTSPGVCSNCTAPPAGYYYTSNGGLSDSCSTAECTATTTCPIGEWNYGCDQETTPGTCIKCTNAPAGYYYSGNAGVADECEVTECTLECPKGQYNAGCSGTTDPSQCAECDKPPDGYYFTSFGDYRSDSCTSEPCVADCPSGQFKAGCDGKPPVLLDGVEVGGLCANCSLPPIGYYITGAGSYYDNCPSSPCKGCDIGFYRAGCDGTTSPGTCEACNVTDGSYILTSGTNDDPNSCRTIPCIDDCEIGYYKEGCSFTSNGTCTNCTILPEGFYFISNGNFEDACQFKHGKVKYSETLGNVFAGDADGNEIFGNEHSIVATGTDNTLVSGAASVLVGGASNTLNGASGTIAGGQLNALYSKGAYSTIAGGYENVAGAKFVTVAGGRLNRALSNYATVVGGYGNKAFGRFATVIGGSRNTASGLRSTAMGYLGFARAVNSMVWAFDSEKTLGCKVDKTDPNQFQVCTQSFVVNGNDFLSMLDSEADDNANTCSDAPGDGISAYCQQTGLEVGTECVKTLASCSGSGRATVTCEAGDAGAIAVGAQWSDPVCLECPPDGCYGHDCHYYMDGGAGGGSYTCDVLEASYGCDCAACSCGSRRLSEEEEQDALQDKTQPVTDDQAANPCDGAHGCKNYTFMFAANGSRHAALTDHLELSKRLHDVKAAYHEELNLQHEHLATVSQLMRKVEKLQAVQNEEGRGRGGGSRRRELVDDGGFANQKKVLSGMASKEEEEEEEQQAAAAAAAAEGAAAASVPTPRPETTRHPKHFPAPSPTPTPATSPFHPTPKVREQKAGRHSSPQSAFDFIHADVVADSLPPSTPKRHHHHRRNLATRKDLLVTQVDDVAALAADIAAIRSTMSLVQRLPADTASTPSGSCTDPAIVYDGSNVYVCDGSAWTALTPV